MACTIKYGLTDPSAGKGYGISDIHRVKSFRKTGSGMALVCLFLLTGSVAIAQDDPLETRISLPDTSLTIGELLNIAEKVTSLSVSYNTSTIDRRKKITITATESSLKDLLASALEDPTLEIKTVGRHLVIYRPLVAESADPANNSAAISYFEIRGRVFDKALNQPLAFANIFLSGTSTGTISNQEGEFILKLDGIHINDTLNISFIGYKTQARPVSLLVNTERNYYLETEVISLQEVIIRKITHQNIIAMFISNIGNNYPSVPALLTTFYRETIKKGNRFMIVSEALLEIFKRPYGNFDTPDQIKIIKGRNSQDLSREDTLVLKLKAGLNSMLLLDVVKNLPSFVTEQEKYDYIFSDIVVEDGRENFAVDFSPSRYAADAYYTGRIYIDIDDYSLKKAEFSIDPSKLDDATRLFVLKKPPGIQVKLTKASYEVSFRSLNGKYYLYHISSNTGFMVKRARQLVGSTYHTLVEMVVTGVDTSGIQRFSNREVARTTDFTDSQFQGYDEGFWGEFNFLKPEDPLERAAGRLSSSPMIFGE